MLVQAGHLHRTLLVLRAICCPFVLFRSPCCEAAGPAPCAPQHGCVLLWGLQSFFCPVSQCIGLIPVLILGVCKCQSLAHVLSYSSEIWRMFPRFCCFPFFTLLRQFRKYRAVFAVFTVFSPACKCQICVPMFFLGSHCAGVAALVDLLHNGSVNAPCCSSADEQYILLTTPVKCPSYLSICC